jgi:hypothetical protein
MHPQPGPSAFLNRRRLLQAGSLGLLGLSLPRLLEAGEALAAKAQPKSCIFIYQYGGLSQLDSWDPKPNAPAEMRGPYKPISTAVPGFQVGELMPRLAKLADRYAVIRSLSHKVPVHDATNKMLLAGSSQPPVDAPSLGAIISRQNPATKNVPSHVWLQKFGGRAAPPDPSYLTGGFLGMANSPLLVGVGHDDNSASPGFKVKALETAEGAPIARLEHRRELLTQLRRTCDPLADAHRCRVMGQFQEKAFQLLAGPEARDAFSIDKEPTTVRDRYGRHPLGQNLLLARRLIEAGVRLVSVVGWMGLAPGEKFMSVETWDMHGNGGVDIFGNGWNGLGYASLGATNRWPRYWRNWNSVGCSTARWSSSSASSAARQPSAAGPAPSAGPLAELLLGYAGRSRDSRWHSLWRVRPASSLRQEQARLARRSGSNDPTRSGRSPAHPPQSRRLHSPCQHRGTGDGIVFVREGKELRAECCLPRTQQLVTSSDRGRYR